MPNIKKFFVVTRDTCASAPLWLRVWRFISVIIIIIIIIIIIMQMIRCQRRTIMKNVQSE